VSGASQRGAERSAEMLRINADVAFRVIGETITHGHQSFSLRSDDASLVCVLISRSMILTGVRRVQFALQGRTANLTAVPSGSIGSAHPLG